jgi:hypothetical protein
LDSRAEISASVLASIEGDSYAVFVVANHVQLVANRRFDVLLQSSVYQKAEDSGKPKRTIAMW